MKLDPELKRNIEDRLALFKLIRESLMEDMKVLWKIYAEENDPEAFRLYRQIVNTMPAPFDIAEEEEELEV